MGPVELLSTADVDGSDSEERPMLRDAAAVPPIAADVEPASLLSDVVAAPLLAFAAAIASSLARNASARVEMMAPCSRRRWRVKSDVEAKVEVHSTHA